MIVTTKTSAELAEELTQEINNTTNPINGFTEEELDELEYAVKLNNN